MPKVKRLGPWRVIFQWFITLSILLLPWFKAGTESSLRIDIPSLTLFFFGQALRIEELYLFLFITLFFVLAFLLVTLVFGRLWCGWACPQTVLNDIADWLISKIGLKTVDNRLQGPLWRKAAIHLCYLLLAFLVASNLLWYFIEPQRFFAQLAGFDLHFAAVITLLIVLAAIYLDLALVRRLMCSEFCPYGRIQTALVDPGTLTLHIPDSEKERCIRCGACVRSCPMGIDIRNGYQVECINCGRCLDACRVVMVRREQPGLIQYSFGASNKGASALLNPRTLLIATAMLALTVIITVSVLNRADASLKIARSHLASEKTLADGRIAFFFNGWINNRSQHEETFTLQLEKTDEPGLMELKGQTAEITIAPGANRRIDFVLVAPALPQAKEVELFLSNSKGEQVARANGSIPATIEETQ
ncbi:MAG: FeS-binding protein [Desulfuromonas sp.]|nr:MAG: FeS-binding protein [Desulfuromonas sp.]